MKCGTIQAKLELGTFSELTELELFFKSWKYSLKVNSKVYVQLTVLTLYAKSET